MNLRKGTLHIRANAKQSGENIGQKQTISKESVANLETEWSLFELKGPYVRVFTCYRIKQTRALAILLPIDYKIINIHFFNTNFKHSQDTYQFCVSVLLKFIGDGILKKTGILLKIGVLWKFTSFSLVIKVLWLISLTNWRHKRPHLTQC